jgi:hypothetical protein
MRMEHGTSPSPGWRERTDGSAPAWYHGNR